MRSVDTRGALIEHEQEFERDHGHQNNYEKSEILLASQVIVSHPVDEHRADDFQHPETRIDGHVGDEDRRHGY